MPRRNVVGRSGPECTATDGVRDGLLECYKIACTPTQKNDNTHSTYVITNSAHIYTDRYIEQKV